MFIIVPLSYPNYRSLGVLKFIYWIQNISQFGVKGIDKLAGKKIVAVQLYNYCHIFFD